MAGLAFVSIIVPVYNNEKIIGDCIEALLGQDYPKDRYEVIIIDNNSTDKSAEIIKSYPVQYALEDTIQTSYAARNRGVKSSRGEILAFLDADCIAEKDWLKKGAGGFAEDNIGCVTGEVKSTKPQNYVEEYLCKKDVFSQKSSLNNFFLPRVVTANTFYRRDVFNKIGFFRERWVSGGDADFGWRMQLETAYKVKFISDAVVFHKHRSTLESMFKQSVKWGIGSVLLYKKYKGKIPPRRLKETLWIIQRLFYIAAKSLIFFFSNKEKMEPKKRGRYLDLVSFMGWEIGRVIGSIKNRVFYI